MEPTPPPVDPTPVIPPVEETDTTAPVITVSSSSVNVIAGVEVHLGESDLKLGDNTVATWTDDVTKTCKNDLSFTSPDGTVKSIDN